MKINKGLFIASLLVSVFGLSLAQTSTTSTSSTSYGSWEWSGWSRDGNSSSISSQIATLPAWEQDLYIPVLLGVTRNSISPNFAAPRDGGTRSHEGEDMMAKKGTPIVSPTDAVITNTGNGASSGIFISSANPGGESFVYMHLDSIAEGIKSGVYVKKGQIIGFVGDTGNAIYAGSHLHFEIRKNGATDPYPRLTKEFTLAEKIQSINEYLNKVSNPDLVAQNLVNIYKQDFLNAKNQNITLHNSILTALFNFQISSSISPSLSTPLPYHPVSSTSVTSVSISPNFGIGSSGGEIVKLQTFLINKNTGPAAQALAAASATGYFGNVTKNALIEFQLANTISATGYFGPITSARVNSELAGNIIAPSPVINTTTNTKFKFTLPQKFGDVGEDVRQLQIFLNKNGFTVTSVGTGSRGYETTYFGQRTMDALIKYQTANNLSPTGELDIQTINYINSKI